MAKKYTLNEARKILGVSAKALAETTGLSMSTINKLDSDRKGFKTRYDTAHLIATALGLDIYEIKWPNGLSDAGRTPLTHTPILKRRKITITVVEDYAMIRGNEVVCTRCNYALPTGSSHCDCN